MNGIDTQVRIGRMQLDTGNVLTVILALLGFAATYAVAWHFTRPKLEAQLLFDVTPFVGIDPALLEKLLQIPPHYFDDVRHIEFRVTNIGGTAVRTVEDPLTLKLADRLIVLDIAHVGGSKDLQVEIVDAFTASPVNLQRPVSENTFEFRMGLMNPGEWFQVKVFVKGQLSRPPADWVFSIRGENLPSTIEMKPMASDEHNGHWTPLAPPLLAIAAAGLLLYWSLPQLASLIRAFTPF